MQKRFLIQARDSLQNGEAFKRWLYRGKESGWIAKFHYQRWALAATKNAMPNGLVALVLDRFGGILGYGFALRLL